MDMKAFLPNEGEKPLERPVSDGGYCGIFRKIACIGDSLSSGEFESMVGGVRGYHDRYDYSWGQFLARDAGCTVYNFSQGGMTAKVYVDSFAQAKNFWSPEYAAQAYIVALGVNDMSCIARGDLLFGELSDINQEDPAQNKQTFVGYYAAILQRYRKISPRATFFLMSMPRTNAEPTEHDPYDKHCALLYALADMFDNTYVLDFRRYAPVYDAAFKEKFYLGTHLNPMGYRLTATMVESYIDYIIRHHMADFKEVGFWDTDLHYEE